MNTRKYQQMMVKARKRMGISQYQLAEELGLSDRTIWSMENRHRVPTYGEAETISQVLLLDFDRFWNACLIAWD